MINTAKIQQFLDMPNTRIFLFFKKVTICSLFDVFLHLLCVFLHSWEIIIFLSLPRQFEGTFSPDGWRVFV